MDRSPGPTSPDRTSTPEGQDHRSVAVILGEIRDVERFLTDVPPHTGEGTRSDLHSRLDRLRRELRDARRGT